MIRYSLLLLAVGFLCVLTWRDRFLALCGLALLTVLGQHPDFPNEVAGIPGLNLWNILFAFILLSWLTHPSEPLPPAPRAIVVLVAGYFVMLFIGALVALVDIRTIQSRWPILGVVPGHAATVEDGVKDWIINPFKYLVTGLLLFIGCRTRRQAWQLVGTICMIGLAFSLLTYRALKLKVFTGDYTDARRMTTKLIGLHANDLAGLLTMAFWALVVVAVIQRKRLRMLSGAGALLVLPTLVGCHSRAAYISNVVIAITLALARWRRMLLLLPLALGAGVLLFPQIAERMGMGFAQHDDLFEQDTDWNEVTAGRTRNIWAPMVNTIWESPVFGHGRQTISRSPAAFIIFQREGFVPGHPHNSYLELLTDFGFVGLAWMLALFFTLMYMSWRLLQTRDDPLVQIAGGIGFVAIVNVMVLGLSSQFFYPKESLIWILASCALCVRVWTIQQERMRAGVSLSPPMQPYAPNYEPYPYPSAYPH